MDGARKLPCGHLFHNSCLRSWLEQDTSCPTCRTSLKSRTEDEDVLGNHTDRENRNANNRTNHFFHFDGSRYASWLPSVSVEVTRPHLINIGVGPLLDHENLAPNTRASLHSTQIEAMARQVLEFFPHMPMSTIIEDLQISRSIELTIENILEGRVIAASSSNSNNAPSSSRLVLKHLK